MQNYGCGEYWATLFSTHSSLETGIVQYEAIDHSLPSCSGSEPSLSRPSPSLFSQSSAALHRSLSNHLIITRRVCHRVNSTILKGSGGSRCSTQDGTDCNWQFWQMALNFSAFCQSPRSTKVWEISTDLHLY